MAQSSSPSSSSTYNHPSASSHGSSFAQILDFRIEVDVGVDLMKSYESNVVEFTESLIQENCVNSIDVGEVKVDVEECWRRFLVLLWRSWIQRAVLIAYI
ncbi:hypothetical protein QVD17_23500 [Tagetes erecta]|uniref:Uncharacterized protein n=1 Tax=Tagetes erecta TaxID=13708 RepID=A0AAD8NUB9_TARER|nr:hypothetical protein QVD17_23500 [Tagetes erecta]